MNALEIEGMERFERLRRDRGRDRGLLTYSNHVSLFDDPILVSNFSLPRYEEIRWTATDAINFFGSRPKAWLFTAGKGVPIVRGAGINQTGFHFLRERLAEGAWVQIFPEGGRTRDPQALMRGSFKAGIGRLMAEARPLVLPWYHYGMHEVLPVGAKLPRRGHPVRVVFGEALDCDDAYVRSIAAQAGDAALQGPPLWEALAAAAHAALRRLELQVHPTAARSAVGTPGEPG
jgi:monolysocardiolipin acyltransferase